MHKRTQADLERAKITKITRTLIRLKHSLQADEEINEILPDRLDDFDRALQEGAVMRLRSGLEDILD